MKKLIAIIGVQMLILSFSFSVQAGTFKRAKKIEITYCWGMDHVDPLCSRQIVELHTNGDAIVSVSGQQFVGTYNKGKRQGVKFIDIDYSGLNVAYTGEQTSRRVYEGSMQSSSLGGSWAGILSNL